MEASDAVLQYINSVSGNIVPAWSKKTSKYFDWHRNIHGFEPVKL
jgi:hypothetical protein